MRRLGPACAALLVVGCGPRATRAPEGLRVEPGALDAAALLAEVAGAAERAGGHGAGMLASGILREGERTGAFVEPLPARSGGCVLLYARGAPSVSDLDLSVLTDEGEPLAVDEEPDATPGLLLCPPLPTRLYVTARVATGSGLVALGAQRVDPARAQAVTQAAAARPALARGARRLEEWPELEQASQAERTRLGAGAVLLRQVGLAVDSSLTTRTGLELSSGQCVSLVLVREPGVGPLDVEIEDGRGALVTRTSRADEPLAVCATAPVALSASLRPHSGRGLVGAAWVGAPAPGAGEPTPLHPQDAAAYARSQRGDLEGLLQRQGAQRVQRLPLALRPSAVEAPTLRGLAPERCYLVSASTGAAGARLRLTLLDEQGREIVERAGGPLVAAAVCGVRAVRAAVATHQGRGAGELALFALPRALEHAPERPAAASRLATLLFELRALNSVYAALTDGTLDRELVVPAEQCRVVGLGDAAGEPELWITEGDRTVPTRRSPTLRWVRLCAGESARVLGVHAQTRAGLLTIASD